MDDIQDFEDGYDMPGAFHDGRDLDGQEQRIWDGGKDRQRNHRHSRRMTPLPRQDGPKQKHSQEKRGLRLPYPMLKPKQEPSNGRWRT